jgi:hypothetical protein
MYGDLDTCNPSLCDSDHSCSTRSVYGVPTTMEWHQEMSIERIHAFNPDESASVRVHLWLIVLAVNSNKILKRGPK